MAYGIMRIEKRGRSAVNGIRAEANRTLEEHERGRDFPASDIDWDRTDKNLLLIHTQNWNKEITRQIREAGVKERKNSIVMLDGIYTASKEWFDAHPEREEQLRYFKDCFDFHVRHFCQGDPSRVINAVVHMDETTPHMHLSSVPIVKDETGLHLSAKLILGGRQDFHKRQDLFHDEVSKQYGMERGTVRDPEHTKKHVSKRAWQLSCLEEEIRENTALYMQQKEALDDIKEAVARQTGYMDRQSEKLKQYESDIQESRDKLQALNALVSKIDAVDFEVRIEDNPEWKLHQGFGRHGARVSIPLADVQVMHRKAIAGSHLLEKERALADKEARIGEMLQEARQKGERADRYFSEASRELERIRDIQAGTAYKDALEAEAKARQEAELMQKNLDELAGKYNRLAPEYNDLLRQMADMMLTKQERRYLNRHRDDFEKFREEERSYDENAYER